MATALIVLQMIEEWSGGAWERRRVPIIGISVVIIIGISVGISVVLCVGIRVGISVVL